MRGHLLPMSQFETETRLSFSLPELSPSCIHNASCELT